MLEFLTQVVFGPIVAAIVVLVAQVFVQPIIQKRITTQTELWLHKMKTYIKAIELVDMKFDSLKFSEAEPVGEPPAEKEINGVYRELLLISDNQEIVVSFQKFMSTFSNNYNSPVNRGKFIKLLRTDLGKPKLAIKDELIPYFRKKMDDF